MPRKAIASDIDLSSVVAGIVRAVQEGKRLGDLESARLAEEYRRDQDLSAFSVPAFAVADVTVELRFAVTKVIDPGKGGDGVPKLQISLDLESLKNVDPQHIQVLRLQISPLPMRVISPDEGNG